MTQVRMRRAAALVGMSGIVLIVAFLAGLGVSPTDDSPVADDQAGIILLPEEGLCVPVGTDLEEDVEPLNSHNTCHSCPKFKGCTRVSCDPCCYQCVGDPITRCL